MHIRNLIYSICCLSFAIVIGATVYEHLAVVPQWTAAPPRSLAMFQGTYGLQAQNFWKPIHPVTLLLFVVTLYTSWKSARKINVLLAFVGYFLGAGRYCDLFCTRTACHHHIGLQRPY